MRLDTVLGRARVTRVLEWQVEFGTQVFPHTPAQAWVDNAELLVPWFHLPESGRCRVAMQTWVIDVDGLRVLIDTGVGNDRERPHLPALQHLHTAYLDGFAAAGIDLDTVDIVVNTHLHTDHVGWNTHLQDGRWVPTFRNARYLLPEADYRYFSPDGPGASAGMGIVFADSIFPLDGQIELCSGETQLSDSLWLRPAPGHTPGSTVIWLDAGAPAVFVGDLTHSPIQIPRPDDPCAFDVDPAAAAVTRKRIFTEAARLRATVIPAHYPGHGGATLIANDDRFSVQDWLDLPPI